MNLTRFSLDFTPSFIPKAPVYAVSGEDATLVDFTVRKILSHYKVNSYDRASNDNTSTFSALIENPILYGSKVLVLSNLGRVLNPLKVVDSLDKRLKSRIIIFKDYRKLKTDNPLYQWIIKKGVWVSAKTPTYNDLLKFVQLKYGLNVVLSTKVVLNHPSIYQIENFFIKASFSGLDFDVYTQLLSNDNYYPDSFAEMVLKGDLVSSLTVLYKIGDSEVLIYFNKLKLYLVRLLGVYFNSNYPAKEIALRADIPNFLVVYFIKLSETIRFRFVFRLYMRLLKISYDVFDTGNFRLKFMLLLKGVLNG